MLLVKPVANLLKTEFNDTQHRTHHFQWLFKERNQTVTGISWSMISYIQDYH